MQNRTQVCQRVSTTPTILLPKRVLTGCPSRDYKSSSRGPAAPPSTKLMSSTLYNHHQQVLKSCTHCFASLSSQQSEQTNTGVQQHEVPEQPGRQPPDRTGGLRVGQHGQRGLGEPRLLWLPSASAQSCQHHLQPPAPVPGLNGQHVQTGHPRPVPGGTTFH